MSGVPAVTTFLMFEGDAEEAISLYTSMVPGSEITEIVRHPQEGQGPGPAGQVHHARFTLGGQPFMAIDSAVQHAFTFTPAMSLYLTCGSADDVDALYEGLSRGGEVLMPLDAYPFSERYVWFQDRFGVSWQLTLGGP